MRSEDKSAVTKGAIEANESDVAILTAVLIGELPTARLGLHHRLQRMPLGRLLRRHVELQNRSNRPC